MEPVLLALCMRGGHIATRPGNTIKGSGEDPMTERERLDGVRGCLAFGLEASPQTADRLAKVVLSFESFPDAASAVQERLPESHT